MTALIIVVVVAVVLIAVAGRDLQPAGHAAQPFKNAFSQIDVQLKRRYDLIPNLVETAKGYMKHERETLEAVIAARNQAQAAVQAAAAQPGRPRGDAGTAGARRPRSPARSAGSSPWPRPTPTSRPTRTCCRSRRS